MGAVGEARKCAVVLAEALTNRHLQIGSGVLSCSAFRCIPSYAHTHTQLSPGFISSIKLASRAEREAKRPCTDWHGMSPHFSASASNLFPFFFFLPLTQFLCAVFVCMQGFVFWTSRKMYKLLYCVTGLTTYCTFCQGNTDSLLLS